MAEIYLIGTVHTEIRLKEKLESRLYEIKPDIVLVEGKKFEKDGTNHISVYTFLKLLVNELNEQRVYGELREFVLKSYSGIVYQTDVSRKFTLTNNGQLMYLGDDNSIGETYKTGFLFINNTEFISGT